MLREHCAILFVCISFTFAHKKQTKQFHENLFFFGFLIYICVLLFCLLFFRFTFGFVVGSQQPRKILLEQLVRCMPADDALPDHVVMVSGADLQGCNLAGRLAERQQRAVCTGGVADVRATVACLVSKIQKL